MNRGIKHYVNEITVYGGVPTKRIDVIKDLQEQGLDQASIDNYLFVLDKQKWGGKTLAPEARA